jgi:hypothetical protein
MRPRYAVLCGAALTLVGTAVTAAPANEPSPPQPDRVVGYVTGFDAFANKEKVGDVLVFVGEVQPPRCNRVLRDTSHSDVRQEVQLVAKQPNLQLALQLAEASCAQVEVNYVTDPKTSTKVLTRVRVMDR